MLILVAVSSSTQVPNSACHLPPLLTGRTNRTAQAFEQSMACPLRLLAPGLSLWIWALDVCSAGFRHCRYFYTNHWSRLPQRARAVVNTRHNQLVDMTTHLQHVVVFLMLCHSARLSLYSIWTQIMMPYWLNFLLLPNRVFHHNQ